ncbi:hypothetical protein MMC27_001259 [Xylographa pallens]|nr:hypothetical protein [Xylographa pallens]
MDDGDGLYDLMDVVHPRSVLREEPEVGGTAEHEDGVGSKSGIASAYLVRQTGKTAWRRIRELAEWTGSTTAVAKVVTLVPLESSYLCTVREDLDA